MNRDSVKLLLLFCLIGVGVLFLAGPIGDWVQSHTRPHQPESDAQPLVASTPSALPVLHLKHDMMKAPNETVDEGPKLPPPTPERHGTLANDEIETALEQRQSSFQRCWTQRLKDLPGLTGNVLLQFEINGRGKVQTVMVAESSINDDLMVRCLISVLERISFREFDGAPISLTFPLAFE